MTPPPWRSEYWRKAFQFVTAAALGADGDERIDWIVEPYVARGSITDLVSAAKDAGKTTLLLAMVHCVLDGQDFLGRPTTQSKVVYLTEERRPTFREALKRVGLLGREDLTILFWQHAWGFSFSQIVGRASEECSDVGAGLLIVDTINQFAGFQREDENHSRPVLEAMQPLQHAAGDSLAVVMGRLERKAGGRVGKSGRGSAAFTGSR